MKIDDNQTQELTQSEIFSPQTEESIILEKTGDIESEIEQKFAPEIGTKISKPKRSKSPSSQKKGSLDKDIEVDEREEDEDYIVHGDIEINLAESTSKHIRLQSPLETPQNIEVLEDKQYEKRPRIKRRPIVMLDLEKGQMKLQLPVISFPGYEVFKNSRPISCVINILDLQGRNIIKTIELTEQNCKIEKYNETPVFLNLDLFKNFRCKIQTPNREIQRNYYFLHENEKIFIFFQKNETNILLYNFKSFFKETDKFWILLKNDLKITPNPTSIFENLVYPNYNLFNIGFKSDNYEIQIFDENNNFLVNLFKEPKIHFSSQNEGYIFDEFYNEEPLFWTNFNINLECSDFLKKIPKMVYIQNSITDEYIEQKKFYNKIKWIKGDKFEISPEHLNNKIGSFQIDIEFYRDDTYTEPLFDKSIRGFFRYCPVRIEQCDLVILPTEKGHKDFEINMMTVNDQLLSIERSDIDFKTETLQNSMICKKFSAVASKDIDQFELIIKSPHCINLVRLKPYIPRVKWRLKNIEKFENLTGKPINFDFDNCFKLKKNITLEIRVISKDCFNGLFIIFDDKKYPLRISDKKNFIYSFPLNPIYEEINRYIKKEGMLQLYLIIEGRKILVMKIIGKKDEYFEHVKSTKKRILTGDHSQKIKHQNNFKIELKVHGYQNSKGNKVISALITILSKEVRYTLEELRNRFFNDKEFNDKINSFLKVNNIIPTSEMTYQSFINSLWEVPYRYFEEILDYLENN
ncbi:MAG: hypothetical protein ACTSXH_13190 [Promethearchaeota archaeon]